MIKVIIHGAGGAMGKALQKNIALRKDVKIIAGIDSNIHEISSADFPVYSCPKDCKEKADVVIDFSHHLAVDDLLSYCVSSKTPAVIATTALSESTISNISEAAKVIPVFRSANMSLGINLIAKLMGYALPPLEREFNVEIIEKHHNKKADSPSGTAILLADAINEACETKKNYIYGRHGRADACAMTDLGIHAVRGGTIPGEHTVLFAGDDEVIEITHRALSKNIFANGAIAAAIFLAGKEKGFYSMSDVL